MSKPRRQSAPAKTLTIADLTHPEATRKNIPTAEHQSVMTADEQAPIEVAYPRGNPSALQAEKAQRNLDLDPQLVWRGKDQQDGADLVVQAPPLYIQEKVKPKVLIDDLRRVSEAQRQAEAPQHHTVEMFGDFNGLPEGAERTGFYQHDGHWQNRMILGDSLAVMASLAEREGLRGQVQCIYFDPPYGIKFNSNFQWSTTSRDVKDGKAEHITREPEQVKAFRDTWRDGIHSYLSYLRDRLIVARDLLTDSGSIFVQIGDENVHRVRCLMDEVFGEGNYQRTIYFATTGGFSTNGLSRIGDYVIWYSRSAEKLKYRQMYLPKIEGEGDYKQIDIPSEGRRRLRAEEIVSGKFPEGRVFRFDKLTSQGVRSNTTGNFDYQGRNFHSGISHNWKTSMAGMNRLMYANRIHAMANSLSYVRYFDDFPVMEIKDVWSDTAQAGTAYDKLYVVQTATQVIQRCLLMSTDPGDLVLDPTCGSGTTATVAEQWGRRWITIDTSRVALALARARIMGARYPYYLLADSKEGQRKTAEITQRAPSQHPTYGNINLGFVYERVPHITLKSIANNADIDTIWDKHQKKLAPLLAQLNASLKAHWQEWEVPRQDYPQWSEEAYQLHQQWWKARIARQKEIDASIAARAEFENLYDKPYEDKKRVRVAGPFTVESLSPHRVLAVGAEGELIDPVAQTQAASGQDFASLILANLKTAGVQQAHKADKINFTTIVPWPGELICAQGQYEEESGTTQRAAIFIGPEFGTVTRADLTAAAREAGDAGCDVLIACAFNYDAPASEFSKLGRIHVLKARMNADLHMAEDLKNTGSGNLFVIFGEPDIDVQDTEGRSLVRYQEGRDTIDTPENGQLVVKINGVDVFHPATGEIRSDDADGIACWLLDSDYNEESFFVRHAYFLGANDPYKALKTTLKTDIDADAWASLHSDTSRPFPVPASGRFAVKVINHLGDEVMKVFRVG